VRLALTLIVLGLSIYFGEPALKVLKSNLFINLFNLLLAIRVLAIVLTLFAARHPFSIYPDYVLISAFLPVKILKAGNTIEGRAISEKNGQICLIVRHHANDSVGEIRIPWQIIKEPQHEVLQKIDELLLTETETF